MKKSLTTHLLARMLLAFLLMANHSCATAQALHAVPTISEVGTEYLPENIAPVTAPFAMPQFKKPVFPALKLDVVSTGAREGESATRAIQTAIDRVSKAGGGQVVIPKGRWKTGRIILKSNVNLHVSEGAEVKFSGEVEDYNPPVLTRNEGVEVMSLGALIYANGQTNIAVTGKGKLSGPPLDSAVRKQIEKPASIPAIDKISANTPVAARVYDGKNGGPVFPPAFFGPVHCKGVYLEGVSLESSAFWNIVPVYCDGVIIRGVTVNSVGIPRGDGIDIDSSRNVLIEYTTLNCGDDCFTLKAGRGDDALRVNVPTENVVIRQCLALKGLGGVTYGSETGSMIRNIYAHDCVFTETDIGIRFKTRRPRGGGGENLICERIRMVNCRVALGWDMLGRATNVGDTASRLPFREVNPLTPAYRNIVARDLVIGKISRFIELIGIPESPVVNVLIENVDVGSSARLIQLQDVDGFTLKNARVKSTDSNIGILDGRNILFDNVKFDVPEGKVQTQIKGDLSKNVKFIAPNLQGQH